MPVRMSGKSRHGTMKPPSGNPAFQLKKAPGTCVSGAEIYIEKVLVYCSSYSISSIVPSE